MEFDEMDHIDYRFSTAMDACGRVKKRGVRRA
jgi:hypothetical protein